MTYWDDETTLIALKHYFEFGTSSTKDNRKKYFINFKHKCMMIDPNDVKILNTFGCKLKNFKYLDPRKVNKTGALKHASAFDIEMFCKHYHELITDEDRNNDKFNAGYCKLCL